MSRQHIEDLFEDAARGSGSACGHYAIAFAILKLAKAQESCAVQLKYLGNGDAATPMGAIEAFGEHMGNKIDSFGAIIGEAVESIGDAIAGLETK